MRCGWKGCRSKRSVKNVGPELRLSKARCCPDAVRVVRKHAKTMHFCSRAHLTRSQRRPAKRGGRDPLDGVQLLALFEECLEAGLAYLGVLILMQVQLGERATAALHCQFGWFHHLGGEGGRPSVCIPKINAKTTPRRVYLCTSFAQFLHACISCEPLRCPDGASASCSGRGEERRQQWPFPSQPCGPMNYLFPGAARQVGEWSQPVTRQGYLFQLKAVGERLRRRNLECFQDFDFKYLGTHSLKKTCVGILADICSESVIARICGTTIGVLRRYYDVPTHQRLSKAVNMGFSPLVHAALSTVPSMSASTSGSTAENASSSTKINFCPFCGARRAVPTWGYCPACGALYPWMPGSMLMHFDTHQMPRIDKWGTFRGESKCNRMDGGSSSKRACRLWRQTTRQAE